MTDNQMETSEYQEAPEKRNNRTLWIILGVLGAILICCCVLAAVGAFMYIPDWYNQFNF